jgi:methylmalonyl-CoA/ethylmalonyl-CoA epimerase
LVFRHHHVGFLVKDITAAARDMSARLGYVAESGVIEDPVQTAIVQFFRQPGTHSWLELITPSGPDSKLTNALKKGGGLHHLCYEVDDIHRACAYLRDQAMFILAEPVPAAAFPGRRIAWLMDRSGFLVELLERGEGLLSLASIMSM